MNDAAERLAYILSEAARLLEIVTDADIRDAVGGSYLPRGGVRDAISDAQERIRLALLILQTGKHFPEE